jgi:hypothetical protein
MKKVCNSFWTCRGTFDKFWGQSKSYSAPLTQKFTARHDTKLSDFYFIFKLLERAVYQQTCFFQQHLLLILWQANCDNLLPVRERGCSTVTPLSLLIRATSWDVADPMEARDDLDSERRNDKAACSCRDWAMLWKTEH